MDLKTDLGIMQINVLRVIDRDLSSKRQRTIKNWEIKEDPNGDKYLTGIVISDSEKDFQDNASMGTTRFTRTSKIATIEDDTVTTVSGSVYRLIS